MTGFMLEVGPGGSARFLFSQGERVIDRGDEKVFFFGAAREKERSAGVQADLPLIRTLRDAYRGTYTAVTVNASASRCAVTQSPMGGNLPVYYLSSGDRYYVFTSLTLLSIIGRRCRFRNDPELIAEFIYNGFIRSRDTLVEGVYKLLPDEYLEFPGGEMRLGKFERKKAIPAAVSLEEMYQREESIINAYIDIAAEDGENLNIAVSGGYDSNLILHFLTGRGLNVRAFTVGGRRGQDETGTAEKICAHYTGVSLRKGTVDGGVLRCMGEIVKALEGNVYERGVFLQYALADLLRRNGVRYILLGECSDQVFNRNFYRVEEPGYLTNYTDHPYELGTMVVLKKSVLMLNAFGITGLYPFTDEDMLDLGAEITEENQTAKIRQKEMCGAFFDPFVKGMIEKKPGSTSLCALFRDEAEEAEFIANVQRTNEFYDPSFRISYKYGPGESELDYYLCLEYLRVFKQIYCEEPHGSDLSVTR
jgi:asparagine synthase (glutamine-hydrolysing)